MKPIIISLILVILMCKNLFAQETIFINAISDSGNFKNYVGFLHGETNLESNPTGLNLVQQLNPKYWRNSDWFLTQNLAKNLSINTTLVISDFYATFKGGYANAKPWLNWSEYENFVTALVTNYNTAELSPTYWDVWNEPNDVNYWLGTSAHLIECYKRTRLTISTINPAFKIVGPSINSYNGEGIENLLDALATDGIILNAVAWHEFGLPDSLAIHTANFRNRSVVNPLWGNPEIHINEYSPQQTNQIPAFRLGWLYHLEHNNVDWANTACWNNNDGITTWSNCNIGLNGLFWHDEQSPLPAYWITRAYAEMQNGKKIFSANSDAKTVALSSKTDVLQEMRILVGRYYSIDNGTFLPTDIGKESANVTITINNYPYLLNGTVPFTIQKIPKGNLIYQNSPLTNPITIFSGNISVVAGTINVTLPNFLDGDAYYLYFNSTNILGINTLKSENNFCVFPNPSSNLISITTSHINNEKLFIINSIGQIVIEKTLTDTKFTINVEDLPAGIYYIKIGTGIKKLIRNL